MLMDEEKKASIWAAFNDARPHVSEGKWLKNKISEITESIDTEQEFIRLLREEEEKLEDSIRKTDIRIYLTQFERYVTKD